MAPAAVVTRIDPVATSPHPGNGQRPSTGQALHKLERHRPTSPEWAAEFGSVVGDIAR